MRAKEKRIPRIFTEMSSYLNKVFGSWWALKEYTVLIISGYEIVLYIVVYHRFRFLNKWRLMMSLRRNLQGKTLFNESFFQIYNLSNLINCPTNQVLLQKYLIFMELGFSVNLDGLI